VLHIAERGSLARSLRVLAAGRPPVATKGGHWRRGDSFAVGGRPDTLRAHCEISLRTLETDRIDLYQLHHATRRCHCPIASVPSGSCAGFDLKDQDLEDLRALKEQRTPP
jgi:aryl-alcohol dehydrogenase-like predicted oxidoreductase